MALTIKTREIEYTAADGAASRQRMSFAMWHLLLHRLGVQSA